MSRAAIHLGCSESGEDTKLRELFELHKFSCMCKISWFPLFFFSVQKQELPDVQRNQISVT